MRDKLKKIDVESLIRYFSWEKKILTSCFDFKLGEASRLVICFWIDTYKAITYIYIFVNIVMFEITYNTNRYDMIFAPLIGVNRHNQIIIFKCAFLSNEKTVFHLVIQ